MDMPRLFSDKGTLIAIDETKLDPITRGRFDAIRAAYHANLEAAEAVQTALADVDEALAAVRNTEEYSDAHYPKQTFHDLWKETFAAVRATG